MIVISNLPGNDLYQTSITAGHAQAVAFKVDASGPYVLQKVRLRLAAYPDSDPIIDLRRNGSNGLPGTIIHTFSDPTFYNGVRTYEFTGNVEVNANTIYWISIVSHRYGEPFDLKGSDPPQTPTGIWTHAGSAEYFAKSGKWTSISSIPSYSIEDPELLDRGNIGPRTRDYHRARRRTCGDGGTAAAESFELALILTRGRHPTSGWRPRLFPGDNVC